MSSNFSLFLFLFTSYAIHAQIGLTTQGNLEKGTSNNAVSYGYHKDTLTIYSFCGIDSGKTFKDIQLRTVAFNTISKKSYELASVPDSLGKLATAASQLDNIIYVIGGYHVFANGSEKSSNKVHRFDCNTNAWLSDAKQLPVPTDDHVQAVWRDSLIYVLTGWFDSTNTNVIQFYNPKADSWTLANPLPNNNLYKSFGSSGTIIGDNILYFGGASSSSGFPIQNSWRWGKINPKNPKEIKWEWKIIKGSINGYRMACVNIFDWAYWLGGSTKTYNYNGIAYDGSGAVSPNNRILNRDWNAEWKESPINGIPMDLRQAAKVSENEVYLMGGMEANQIVSKKVLKLTWDKNSAQIDQIGDPNFSFFPNPSHGTITINSISNLPIKIISMQGRILDLGNVPSQTIKLKPGIYYIIQGNQSQNILIL